MSSSRRLAFVALCVLTAPLSYAQPRPAPATVVGTWLLQSIVDRLSDGSVTYWMGRHPTGAIVYAPSGHMSVQFMRDPRAIVPAVTPMVGAHPFGALPADQLRDLLEGYYAYLGRYEVNATGDSVTHVIETSLRPTEVGTT